MDCVALLHILSVQCIGMEDYLHFRHFVSGHEVDPSNKTATFEIHNTGDIALAFQQYLHMTNDTGFLVDNRGKEAILDIAEYWASRVQQLKTGMYGALGTAQ